MVPPSNEDKTVNGCFGLLMLMGFVWLIIMAWGFVEIVNWLTSK
jgi:hypothetical protein